MALNYYKLGDRIRFFRQQEKLSQEDLSEKSGIGVVHISNIENGNTKPGVDVIVSIASALNVTPNQLLIDSLPENAQNKNDLNALLLDCSPEEVSILVESFTGLRKVLSKYQIKE